jgi:hypothetical protein
MTLVKPADGDTNDGDTNGMKLSPGCRDGPYGQHQMLPQSQARRALWLAPCWVRARLIPFNRILSLSSNCALKR